MSITADKIWNIATELASLEPTVIPESQRRMTAREAVFALAPVIIKMKVRGFRMQEIVTLLAARGLNVKESTLAKYLCDFSRRQEEEKQKKKDSGQNTEKRCSMDDEFSLMDALTR